MPKQMIAIATKIAVNKSECKNCITKPKLPITPPSFHQAVLRTHSLSATIHSKLRSALNMSEIHLSTPPR